MCFHFPVMPRIFMAVRRESRFPISEILEQTPDIPGSCQWGIFLRNHDELTLEMVERRGPRLHVGRVRQGPADEGQHRHPPAARAAARQRHATRSSCSPRCCCRCPARRSSTTATRSAWATTSGSATATAYAPRCSGPPTATPASPRPPRAGSHLPVIQDPVYGYQRVNVEAQLENASSLLHWTRRMIHARKQHPAFGLGLVPRPRRLEPDRAVLCLREYDDDVILCVNNLSRFPQPVELDLRRFEGRVPVELLGGVTFPSIGELPYLLTLGAYGFYWFRLTRP